MQASQKPRLILASSSVHRRRLLEQLGLCFEQHPPAVDESQRPGESPKEYVLRLAESKAHAVDAPGSLIIGADQAAVVNGAVLGKPQTRSRAVAQLQRLSGCDVEFLTGLCLRNPGGAVQLDCIAFRSRFLQLDQAQIEGYLDREKALECAASLRSDGLGIALLESMHGTDPSALIGLPLIRLTQMLRREGVDPLLA